MLERRCITIQGIVQGVGFRPFIYGLAQRCGLAGYVRNDAAGVTIEVEGEPASIESFLHAVHQETPPLAILDRVACTPMPVNGDRSFAIELSCEGAQKQAMVSPDVCVCDDCLREMGDPADRRRRYPFINCTNCGPRFTIIRDMPYDRAKTSMCVFPMCPDCRAEYENPLDRRFHAQPNACPVCGPTLHFHFQSLETAPVQNLKFGAPFGPQNPIDLAAEQLAGGAILAIKGLGGYHLACDATNGAAVARLRQRKRREAKPFALMTPDIAAARQLCHLNAAEEELLQLRRRPIVLLKRRHGCMVAPEVAPYYGTLGLMLPYTPLHYLLLDAFSGLGSRDHPVVLVMTSGNLSDEPIAYDDDEAQQRLAPLVDGWLTHNRAIHSRCDDSVVRLVAGGPQIFRRSRGYAPEPIRLAQPVPMPLLACGGHLKNTFCLAKGEQAIVSHHIGDLENLETLSSFRIGIEHFQRLFDIQPEAVAYDLHPDYLATKVAHALDIPHKIGVQHHHAHIASVMAEHGLSGPVIGVAADGTGYGPDGAIWGGEIMVADLHGFQRVAHLAYTPMPGGAQAIRQPWRMAAAYLLQTFGDDVLALDIPFVAALKQHRILASHWRPVSQMIQRGLNCPATSSFGRLFDAVAALLGLRLEVMYEGQAAIELEAHAAPTEEFYPFTLVAGTPDVFDVRPMIRAIVEDLQHNAPLPQIAGRFHTTIAELLASACLHVRRQWSVDVVALSGGVFQNRLLLESVLVRLEKLAFQVYINRSVPPNDGGLSLGQAAVAAAQLSVHGAAPLSLSERSKHVSRHPWPDR